MQKERWEYRISPSGGPLRTALEPARRMKFLRLNAAVMARPSYSQDDPPRVKYTGEGLASVLAYIALNDPQGFEDLVAVAGGSSPGCAVSASARRGCTRPRVSWSDSAGTR